jgi:hypothetical protein
LVTVCCSISESIVGVTPCTNQCAIVGRTNLILLTALNTSKASVIQNNLARGITLSTVRGIISESIGGHTLRTNQCARGGTHLILLTVLNTSKANVAHNSLVRGIA